MPLTIERTYDNEIAIYHTFEQNGDLMFEPDMTFEIDTEAQTLSARSFQQSSPPIYQEAQEGDNH